MIALVEYMAKSLVEKPEEVTVTAAEKEGIIELSLKVAEGDMGKVIGKQGRIAKALRSVLKAAAAKEGKKYSLEIG
ncbi:MAG: KH domain-containing protein [Firmicutes bacterium]|nr:KH domain-containing protein [Bacillota bacterium]